MEPREKERKEEIEKRLENVRASTATTEIMRYPPEYLDFKRKVILPHLEIALDRIERGVQGLCIDCGEKIPARRLEAVPAAIRCVSCQKRFEAGGEPSEKEKREARIFEAYREAILYLKKKIFLPADEFERSVYEAWSEATHKMINCPCREGHPELCFNRLNEDEKISMLKGSSLSLERFRELVAKAKVLALASL